MGLLERTLARLVRDDGESRLRHLDRAGRRYTYLQIAGEVGRLAPGGRLIVGFHGLGANERQIETLVPMEIPRGSVSISLRAPHARGHEGWSWFDPPLPTDRSSYEDAVDFVADFVEWAKDIVGVDTERTTLVGYSQAAPLLAAVGQLRPDLASDLVLASAALPEQVLALGHGVPERVFVGVGSKDPLVDHEVLRSLLGQWSPAQQTVQTYDIPHVVSVREAQDISRWIFAASRVQPVA
ncbi:MAG: hypothetical protein AAF480_14895 [Actinomycetota bacterium]